MNTAPNQLGRGTFGEVYACTHKRNPSIVAALKFTEPTVRDTKLGRISGYGDIERRYHEVKLLLKLQVRGPERHRSLMLQLHECFWNGSELHIVTERLGRDLHSWIREQPVFMEHTAKGVAKRLLQALKFMHERGVVHRDLKPHNILFKVRVRRSLRHISSLDAVCFTQLPNAPALYRKAETIEVSKLLILGWPRYWQAMILPPESVERQASWPLKYTCRCDTDSKSICLPLGSSCFEYCPEKNLFPQRTRIIWSRRLSN
jgi:serine/threonine protein kinase